MTSARWQPNAPPKSRRLMRLSQGAGAPTTHPRLFGSQGDLRNLVSGSRDLVAEIAGTQANAYTCQCFGRARLRVLGVLDETDIPQPRRGLRMTRELPSHAGRHCDNGQTCCPVPL